MFNRHCAVRIKHRSHKYLHYCFFMMPTPYVVIYAINNLKMRVFCCSLFYFFFYFCVDISEKFTNAKNKGIFIRILYQNREEK